MKNNQSDKNSYIVKGDYGDFMFIIVSALRYGLGRRTYATSLIPDFIMQNLNIIDNKTLYFLLRELDRYKKDRLNWKCDDECDFVSWTNFEAQLLKEDKARGLNSKFD